MNKLNLTHVSEDEKLKLVNDILNGKGLEITPEQLIENPDNPTNEEIEIIFREQNDKEIDYIKTTFYNIPIFIKEKEKIKIALGQSNDRVDGYITVNLHNIPFFNKEKKEEITDEELKKHLMFCKYMKEATTYQGNKEYEEEDYIIECIIFDKKIDGYYYYTVYDYICECTYNVKFEKDGDGYKMILPEFEETPLLF
jgi:hypothetical protein